jgi:Tol biopolymer transport system component
MPFTVGQPVNLGSTVNTQGFDGGPSSSADGLELYFVSDRAESLGCGDIWVARRASIDQRFGAPENLGSVVNSSGCEGAPSVSSDGRALYFECFVPDSSGRCHGPDGDIYVAERSDAAGPFEAVSNLGAAVNGEHADSFPSITPNGLVLYFASNRPEGVGDSDLWRVTRNRDTDPFWRPASLGPGVNTSTYDGDPAVSPDGLWLIFASDRPGGSGGHDLWLATRPTTDEPFGNPVNLGPDINTPGVERRPALNGDATVLYFMSDRPGGAGSIDLWQAVIERTP